MTEEMIEALGIITNTGSCRKESRSFTSLRTSKKITKAQRRIKVLCQNCIVATKGITNYHL